MANPIAIEWSLYDETGVQDFTGFKTKQHALDWLSNMRACVASDDTDIYSEGVKNYWKNVVFEAKPTNPDFESTNLVR